MSRILITSWGSFGDVYPYVGLARALEARGHQIQLAMPDFYRDLVESLGFAFHAVGRFVDLSDRASLARLIDPVNGAEALVKELVVPSVREDYAALDAAARDVDLIVTHPITFAGPIVAQRRRLPWVSTVLAPTSFFSAIDTPVLAPAPGLIRLRRIPWFGHLVARLARAHTRTWMQPVFDLRRDLGLPEGEHPLFEGQFSPMLTLALFSHVLGAPQPDWPPNVAVTGFVFYNGPEPLQPELETFLSAGPPPLVFTLGTSAVNAAGSFYDESAMVAARLGVRAVLLTGGIDQNRPSATSPDLLLVDRAPHQLLFPRASVIVHQGGAGTTAQALRAGRPMLVVPHAHDQPDNAFRVAQLGVARTIAPSSYRAPRVARVIETLLRDERFQAHASEVAGIVQTEGGADAAAAAVDRLLVLLSGRQREHPQHPLEGEVE